MSVAEGIAMDGERKARLERLLVELMAEHPEATFGELAVIIERGQEGPHRELAGLLKEKRRTPDPARDRRHVH